MAFIDRIQLGLNRIATLFSGRGGGGSYYAQRASQIPSARFDWITEAGDFRQNSVVALGLDWIVRNINAVPLKLVEIDRNGDEVEIKNHPFLELWDNPNPIYSGSILKNATVIDIFTVGGAYWYIADTNGGLPGEIYWLDGRYVAPNFPVDGSEWLHSWKYIPANTGRPTDFTPDQIQEFRKGSDPWNDRLGYSPLMACVREIGLVNMLAGYTGAILKNTGVTNMIISPVGENAITPENAALMRTSIAQRNAGDAAGAPLVLTQPASITNPGITPKDLLLTEVDQVAVTRICAAMGLSPMVLGLKDEGKTYANYREAQRAAWVNGVQPVQKLMAESLEHKLLRRFDKSGRLKVRWDYSQIEALADDQMQLAQRAALLFTSNLIRQNEARCIAGEDETPEGDVYNFELARLAQAETAEMEDDPNEPEDNNEDSGTEEETSQEAPSRAKQGRQQAGARSAV